MVSGAHAGATTEFTDERVWRRWAGWGGLDAVALEPCGKVVVVSAHPDDDVLAVSMLVQEVAEQGGDVSFVIATDGEGSHPNSPTLDGTELALRRRDETDAALGILGLAQCRVTRLGLPDSGLTTGPQELRTLLAPLLRGADVVLAPWAHDAHPDHEEVGRASADVLPPGAVLWEYPVWAWHWATPESDAVPWARARRFIGTPDQLARKHRAVAAFVTQVGALSDDPRDAAVLPPEVLAHFDRPFEVVLT